MTTVLKLFILFLCVTVLHWAFMALLGGLGVSLNMMLVFAVAVCAYVKPEYGYPAAFVCGLFLDFFGVKLFGNHALAFTLCASVVYGLEKRLDFDGILPQIIVVLGLSLFAALFNMLLLKLFTGFSPWNGVGPLLGGITLNALLAPAVFWVVRRMFSREVRTF